MLTSSKFNQASSIFFSSLGLRLVEEIMRVLKIGGHALITIPQRYDLKVPPFKSNGENDVYRSLLLRKDVN